MDSDTTAIVAPTVFVASLGVGAVLAYNYNPTMKLAVRGMNVPDSLMYVMSSDWIRGTFAAGALARLLLFNVRDELALATRGETKAETAARKNAVAYYRPLLISGLMNLAACIVTPANGVFFCSWTAGWELCSMLYCCFWAPTRH